MAGVRVEVTVEDAEVRRAVEQLLKNATAAAPAFDEVGASLVTSTQQRFEDQQGPDGKAWPALALSTQQQLISGRPRKDGKRRRATSRSRRRGPDNILRVKGHLYNSITHLASDEGVSVGTNRVYAALQQLGGTSSMKNAGARAVPPRPFLGISEDDREEIGKIMLEHLEAGL